MHCPVCQAKARVIRTVAEGHRVYRQRKCQGCGRQFDTLETVIKTKAIVVKKDGMREAFDSEKLFQSIKLACRKLHINPEKQLATYRRVIEELAIEGADGTEEEVQSRHIGEVVVKHLEKLDIVAWLRYASYFYDIPVLMSMLETKRHT